MSRNPKQIQKNNVYWRNLFNPHKIRKNLQLHNFPEWTMVIQLVNGGLYFDDSKWGSLTRSNKALLSSLIFKESRKASIKIYWVLSISTNVLRVLLLTWFYSSFFLQYCTVATRPFSCYICFLKRAIEPLANNLLLSNFDRKFYGM